MKIEKRQLHLISVEGNSTKKGIVLKLNENAVRKIFTIYEEFQGKEIRDVKKLNIFIFYYRCTF